MKRWLLIAMVAIAATAYATDVTPIGDGWYLTTVEATLMDPGRTSVMLLDMEKSTAVFVMYVEGVMAVGVNFGEFLASTGKHDKSVMYATDLTGGAKRIPGGWRSSTSVVAWYGTDAERVLADIAEATLLMFRTKDYRDRNVDVAFETTPESTARALEALDAARGVE